MIMLERYGRFVARRARTLLAVSAVAMIVALFLGFGTFGKLKSGGFTDPSAQSTRAEQLIDAHFGGETNLALLVTADRGTVNDAAVAAAGRQLTTSLGAEPNVSGVVSYWSTNSPGLRSTDGSQALVLGHIAGSDDQVLDRAKALVAKYSGSDGPITVVAGGEAGANVDVNHQVTRSLAIAESIAVPITMVLLVLAFGSFVAALLPLVIGGLAILGTFAELFLIGSATDVSIFAINLTTALGLGLGIDYALFIVSRFREQLAAGESTEDAVARTVATAGRTIVFSAATVAAALAAMLVFPLYFLRSFAYAGIGVVAIAALSALVVAPALLAVLGPRVNAGRLPWSRAAARCGLAMVGTARRRRDAAARSRRAARCGAAAGARHAVAWRPLRDARSGSTAGQRSQPAGRRYGRDGVPGQRLGADRRGHHRQRSRPARSPPTRATCLGCRAWRPSRAAPARSPTAPRSRPATRHSVPPAGSA